MKKIEISIPDNTYALTDLEINLIHAMAFYMLDAGEGENMTPAAVKALQGIEEKFRMHEAKSTTKVWRN